MTTPRRRRYVVALTGASGAVYFVRTLRALLLAGCDVDMVLSKFGLVTLREETSLGSSGDTFLDWFRAHHADVVAAEAAGVSLRVHHFQDQAAPIASGSGHVDGMAIVPCSMKTLAGVAHGMASNLIERAADVMLKERRPLVIVPREAPYNLLHLRNMTSVLEAGGRVVPASPAFYQRPKTFDDLGDFIAQRVLTQLGVDVSLVPAWTGLGAAPPPRED
jgi:4-hydroxy-3-polyprenylbenzoate decarboxylase